VLIIFVGIVIGFYIVSTILEFISHFSGINLSLFDSLGNIIGSITKNVKKSTLRIIGKVALLFVVIGFLMPIGFNQTGFKIAEYSFELAGHSSIIKEITSNERMTSTQFSLNIIGMALYVLFISSLIGGVLLIPLIMNKKIDIGFDWASLLVSIACAICANFSYSTLKESFDIYGALDGQKLQIGGYFILFGLSFSLLAVFIASLSTEKESG